MAPYEVKLLICSLMSNILRLLEQVLLNKGWSGRKSNASDIKTVRDEIKDILYNLLGSEA